MKLHLGKSAIISLLLTLLFKAGFCQFPNKISGGSPNTLDRTEGAYGSDSGYVFIYGFPDTASANRSFLKNTAGLVIRVANKLYLRANDLQSWIEIGSSSGGGSTPCIGCIDSISSISVPYIDTLKFYSSDSLIGQFVVKKKDGLNFGCSVVAINDSTFGVSAASYNIGGIEINSPADTIQLNNNYDSLGLYAVIGVNNTGNTFSVLGATAVNPQVPQLTSNQIGCATIYFPESGGSSVLNVYNNTVVNIGVDSSAFNSLTQLTDTSAIWCDRAGRCDTLILRNIGGDGLLSGGGLTKISDTQIRVDSAFYQLQRRLFISDSTTVTIAVAGDTARIDRIVADTSGNIVVIQGTESTNPSIPSYNITWQVDLGFVYVSDTVYTSGTSESYWSETGGDIQNNTGANVKTAGQFRATNGINFSATPNFSFDGWKSFSGNKIAATVGNWRLLELAYVGAGYGSSVKINSSHNSTSGSGNTAALEIGGNIASTQANVKSHTQLLINPTYSDTLSTGAKIGIDYNPIVDTLRTGTEHIALRIGEGKVIIRGLETRADTGSIKTLVIDSTNGTLYTTKKVFEWSGYVTFDGANDPTISDVIYTNFKDYENPLFTNTGGEDYTAQIPFNTIKKGMHIEHMYSVGLDETYTPIQDVSSFTSDTFVFKTFDSSGAPVDANGTTLITIKVYQ